MKIFTVAILGCGNRGSVYAKLMAEKEDCFKIVSFCDIKLYKRDLRSNISMPTGFKEYRFCVLSASLTGHFSLSG